MIRNDISSNDIIKLKKKYGSIYKVDISGKAYIYRALTRAEFLLLISMREAFEIDEDEYILDKCLLYPDSNNLDNELAGDISYVIDLIVNTSGFSNVDDIEKDIDKARRQVSILDNQIIIFICKAFPRLAPSDIDNFTYDKLLYHLALAEEILGAQLKVEKVNDTIDFSDKNHKTFQGKVPRKS